MIGQQQREIKGRVNIGRQLGKQDVFGEREAVINWVIEQLSNLGQ